jgi:hypothetical protein
MAMVGREFGSYSPLMNNLYCQHCNRCIQHYMQHKGLNWVVCILLSYSHLDSHANSCLLQPIHHKALHLHYFVDPEQNHRNLSLTHLTTVHHLFRSNQSKSVNLLYDRLTSLQIMSESTLSSRSAHWL